MTASIVTYHTEEAELRRCLECLSSAVINRIYVVDNGREERIRKIVEDYPGVEYIASENVGYGRAHNKAIRKALASGSDFHLVLNSDITFDPELPALLLAEMRRRPDVGLMHPRLIYPDGRPQPTARMLPTPLDVFGRRFLPKRLFAGRNARYTLEGLDLNREHDVPYVQGSFMLMSADALRKAGLFDERFFMYPEDIDLTRRIHRDFKTLYYPMLTAVHAHRAESYHSLRMLWIHVSNMIRYFNKWGWWSDPERRKFNRSLRK